MLDNFAMGGPISDHNGVRCYPAMENDTEDKYIVKVISIPASQKQLDALLLSGAYPSTEAALVYFKELSDGVIQEVDILNKLSQMEGFLPYKDFQCIPMENSSGFDVYLLSPYRRTLTKQFTRHPLTHLDAINLGLDLCAALAVCRRAGYLYIALKPNNVFVTSDKGFRIGDLGFVQMDSLKYASLADKYRSEYTPPEISDAFSSLNTTIDTYALGLILYQAYNNGALPFNEEVTAAAPLPPPAYADYEMAEIILKACAPNPEDRWQDPLQMGQAIVTYMQRNGANDTPIVPVAPPVVDPTDESSENDEDAADSESQDGTAESTSEEASQDAPSSDADTDEAGPQEGSTQDTEELPFLPEDELTPDPEELDIEYHEVTDEVNEMLSQADELANHPVPDPVVAPDPIDVPIPPPIVIKEEKAVEESEPSTEKTDTDSADAAAAPGTEEEPSSEGAEDAKDEDGTAEKSTKKSPKRWLYSLLVVLGIASLLAAGVYYYMNFYLLPVNGITLDGSEDSLTVQVDSEIDEALLSVSCSDTYGTTTTSPVVDGKATFTGLIPNTGYTVEVQVDGFHRLTGNTTSAYSTPVQTNIVQFSAVTGSEEGSVVLGFTIEGPDSSQWRITYSAEGEEENSVVFPAHTVTLNGLTIGKEYTFKLQPEDALYLKGESEVTYTASALVYAKDLQITACANNSLTAVWSAPEDTAVESWTVRCYDNDSYNETIVTTETTATFEGLDHTKSFNVEVTAAGMSVAQRTYVAENSVTISNFNIDDSDPNKLVLTWEANQDIPEDGWILTYTIDGSPEQDYIVCEENTATIPTVVPGATYGFALKDLSETPILGVPTHVPMKEASSFTCNYDGCEVKADNLTFQMCKYPGYEGWDRYALSDADYKTTFSVGESASFLVHLDKTYGTSSDAIVALFVTRDENGAFVSATTSSKSWSDMWYRNYCELDIPAMPKTVGNYTMSVYFNGGLAATHDFVITE